MGGKGWKGMVGMKLKLGFWMEEEKSVSEFTTTFPPIVDITWQSPYILLLLDHRHEKTLFLCAVRVRERGRSYNFS